MIIYNYDSETKEYLYSEEATRDNAASERTGKFVPLLPANSTTSEPLSPRQGYAVIFKNNWVYVEDNRGKEVINLTTKEVSTVNYIGEIKEGYMLYSAYKKTDEYKKEQADKKRQEKISILNGKISILKEEMDEEALLGNTLTVEIYKEVIKGLIQTREAI